MPRHNDSRMGTKLTPGFQSNKSKGKRRRGMRGLSTYCKMGKRANADRYSRPYLTGEWKKWRSAATYQEA